MGNYAEHALSSSMRFLAQSQSAIANNLANVESTAYKRRSAHAVQESAFADVLGRQLGTVSYSEQTDWSPAALVATGDQLNVALDGPGHLVVDGAGGQRIYSRNGAMRLDARGRLTNDQGELYLGRDGRPIDVARTDRLPRDGVKIGPDGTVVVGDLVAGRLMVVDIADRDALQPIGGGRFVDTADQTPRASARTDVRQGHLERSNVDALTELVQMITVQRAFEGTARAMTGLGRMRQEFMAAMGR